MQGLHSNKTKGKALDTIHKPRGKNNNGSFSKNTFQLGYKVRFNGKTRGYSRDPNKSTCAQIFFGEKHILKYFLILSKLGTNDPDPVCLFGPVRLFIF